eukprot:338825-Prymnesium_polylepis.1
MYLGPGCDSIPSLRVSLDRMRRPRRQLHHLVGATARHAARPHVGTVRNGTGLGDPITLSD